LRRETQVRIGDGIGDRRGVNHTEGGNRGRFIGAEARPEKIGDGNRGNDQDYRDDEEQLNQRESSVASHVFSTQASASV
jgi:hypothetical protein